MWQSSLLQPGTIPFSYILKTFQGGITYTRPGIAEDVDGKYLEEGEGVFLELFSSSGEKDSGQIVLSQKLLFRALCAFALLNRRKKGQSQSYIGLARIRSAVM